jgi:hypothetical protein
LRPVLAPANSLTELRQMVFHVGLGRFDQGFVPQTLSASGAFTGWMLPDPILTEIETEKLYSRLIPFQGVANTSFARVQRQSDPGQPLD